MGIKKAINKFKILKKYAIIYLEKRTGEIYETRIDLEDLEQAKQYAWHVQKAKNNGLNYASCCKYLGIFNGKPKYQTIQLHRLIMNAEKGDYVDHIKPKETLDNRKKNLRITTNNKNTKNRKSKNTNNKSGYRNVSKIGIWWCVQLQINGINTLLKKFPLNELDEAGAYAELKRSEIYGEFAGLS